MIQVAKYHRLALGDWKEGKNRCIVGYILPSFQSHNASNLWYFAIWDEATPHPQKSMFPVLAHLKTAMRDAFLNF